MEAERSVVRLSLQAGLFIYLFYTVQKGEQLIDDECEIFIGATGTQRQAL